MEVKIQRPAYYFSWPDEEILDEKLLEITGDDETWLYRVEQDGFNGHFQPFAQSSHYHTPSGSVDSRTFTRRKHALRPSLESVAESPLSNRSSLGILSASRLHDTNLGDYLTTPTSASHGRISSNFTASDRPPITRVFKLDTPFTNYPFERKRHDSELSDSSIIPSLDSQFDKHEAMTDSLVNFLEKPNEKCQPQPPAGFQDENPMTESLVSLTEKETDGDLEFRGEAMTDSMVNFLEPVPCKPPSGFCDEEMSNSVVSIDEKDILPVSDMTNSLMEYLECGKLRTAPLTQSTTSIEAENIPPESLNNKEEEFSNANHAGRLNSVGGMSDGKINTTFEINKNRDGTFNIEDESEKSPDISFTNNVNINRMRNEIIDTEDQRYTRGLNVTFEKENGSIHKSRALNNKDLNVNQELNSHDAKEFNHSRFKTSNKSHSSALVNSTRLNGTFTKSTIDSSQMNGTFTRNHLNSPSNKSRQIPQRNSTFNTTFTKLDSPSKDLSRLTLARSTECLDAGVEDDRTSSASDSSFSSATSSTKLRSVDELRSIAQQQESTLVHSSTPSEESRSIKKDQSLAPLDVDLSPIRRASLEGRRVTESRSAHCSPVRSSLPHSPYGHPISRLQQPVIEARRQTLQASSLSNLALSKPRTTGLRMPQPTGRLSMLVRPERRPTTAPAPTPAPAAPTPVPTAIPRPHTSRLPMPRLRASGIPTMKRGGRH